MVLKATKNKSSSKNISNKNNIRQKIFSKQKLAKEMASLLRKIANPTRLLILCQIAKKSKNVSEILLGVEVSQSALSQHLALLKKYKIIADKKDGKFIYYSIKDQKTKKILGFLTNICQK